MIEIKNLSMYLGEFQLKDINLSIGDGEYFVILGPTGAGKTVLMECLAGLHRIKRGEIWLGQREVTHLASEERNVGYVPQDYVLFPFLNVVDNIAFGLKQAKCSGNEIKERVNKLADLMGISQLLHRDTRSLSGGEKQRVALARALAPSPGILLLDEPLGALDLRTAKYLRLELRRVHRELGLTTVHITHDLMEALEMADRVAVVQGGQVEQVAEPEEMLFYPEGERVADFIGAPNILDCDYCRDLGKGIMEVGCGGLKLTVPHEGSHVRKVAILPRHIYVSETRPPGLSVNGFEGCITAIKSAGNTVKIWIDVDNTNLMAEVPSYIFEEMSLAVGKEVFLILRMRRIRCYESNNS
ncbi:MAG TPA: ABC transporter ATP-binding protein [Dehalococcoidales bacterium]|nr:ABC transporter ATP-binding protein [Dehalococcoidales bacterium]